MLDNQDSTSFHLVHNQQTYSLTEVAITSKFQVFIIMKSHLLKILILIENQSIYRNRAPPFQSKYPKRIFFIHSVWTYDSNTNSNKSGTQPYRLSNFTQPAALKTHQRENAMSLPSKIIKTTLIRWSQRKFYILWNSFFFNPQKYLQLATMKINKHWSLYTLTL